MLINTLGDKFEMVKSLKPDVTLWWVSQEARLACVCLQLSRVYLRKGGHLERSCNSGGTLNLRFKKLA